MTDSRSARVSEVGSPVVPVTEMPCDPLSICQSIRLARPSRSTAPSLNGVTMGTIEPRNMETPYGQPIKLPAHELIPTDCLSGKKSRNSFGDIRPVRGKSEVRSVRINRQAGVWNVGRVVVCDIDLDNRVFLPMQDQRRSSYAFQGP